MPGNEITIFTLMNGEKLGVLICWENLFPKLARDEVKAGARILVNLVNDAWFGKTAASRQHNTASVLRAVENAVPVVVASNWGPSQIIDPRGRTVKVSGAFSRDAITGDVPVQGKLTLYTRYGDLFAWACIGAAFLFFICIALNSISLKYNGRFTAMN
jgi:apolipoprotein N-acyltransferase